MNKKEALNQLKSLHYDMEHFQEIESKEEDVKALEYAINELEKTAQEVPVQEQSVSSKLKINIIFKGLNVLKNINENSLLKISGKCIDKTSVEITLFKAYPF